MSLSCVTQRQVTGERIPDRRDAQAQPDLHGCDAREKARSDRGAETGLGDGYAGKADGEAFDGPIALVEVR